MKKTLMMTVTACLMCGCEKMLPENAANINESEREGVKIEFCIDAPSLTRGDAVPFTEVCSRLNVAVFQDGEKVKSVAQKYGDASYGKVVLPLSDGTYQLVAVGHNGAGSATITSEEKVTFPSNKVTDTFVYYGDLVVSGDGEPVSCMMRRVVAKVELHITGELPTWTAQLKFYYLGGSSTFSPRDGFGCVQSKQTEVRDVSQQGVYELYTMPHSQSDVLTRLTVTALDADGAELGGADLTDIPVEVNKVTLYEGNLFGAGGGGSRSNGFGFFVDAEWGGTIKY